MVSCDIWCAGWGGGGGRGGGGRGKRGGFIPGEPATKRRFSAWCSFYPNDFYSVSRPLQVSRRERVRRDGDEVPGLLGDVPREAMPRGRSDLEAPGRELPGCCARRSAPRPRPRPHDPIGPCVHTTGRRKCKEMAGYVIERGFSIRDSRAGLKHFRCRRHQTIARNRDTIASGSTMVLSDLLSCECVLAGSRGFTLVEL